jgi:hypothetical protein
MDVLEAPYRPEALVSGLGGPRKAWIFGRWLRLTRWATGWRVELLRPPFGAGEWVWLDVYPGSEQEGLDYEDALTMFLGEQRRRLEAAEPDFSEPGGTEIPFEDRILGP